MDYSSVIKEAVGFINSNEQQRKFVAEKLVKLDKEDLLGLESKDIQERNFISQIKAAELNCKIAGCDSGFVSKSMHSVDMLLIRAVGVVFEYGKNKLLNSHYFPGFFQLPEPHLSNGALDHDELNCSKSLIRLKNELKAAAALIEKYGPKYCFLDGSIIPQYLDKPRADSNVNKLYHELLEQFQGLYALAEKNDCTLLGCVEDSRGSRFRTIVQKEILTKKKLIQPEQLENLFDSSILDHLLEKGQRSFAFPYSEKTSEHPILNEFGKEWQNSVYAMYLKPTEFDRPLRVEFLFKGKNLEKEADEIASVVYALSSSHREYAYPTILIEADLRARLQPNEVETVFNKIVDKLSKSVKIRLRREGRPF